MGKHPYAFSRLVSENIKGLSSHDIGVPGQRRWSSHDVGVGNPDLQVMAQVIEEDCEKVKLDEW